MEILLLYGKNIIMRNKPQTVVIHTGSNDIIKFNYHDVDVNNLVNRILQIGLKCLQILRCRSDGFRGCARGARAP